MNARMRFSSAGACALAALAMLSALAAFTVRPAAAQCTYLAPAPNTPVDVATNPTFGRVPGAQMKSVWTVFGVRPAAGEDWDLVLYPTTAASPTCVGGASLASSSLGTGYVDYVIGDGVHNAHADVYPRLGRFSGSSGARAAWNDTTIALTLNAKPTDGWFAAGDLFAVYTVSLTAGTPYGLWLNMTSGATLRVSVFRNPSTGTYWAGRSSAVATFATVGHNLFTAPSTGSYAIVVANDGATAVSYEVAVGSCTTPIPLADKVQVSSTIRNPVFSFAPTGSHWGALATGDQGYWTADVYTNPTGGTGYPFCPGGLENGTVEQPIAVGAEVVAIDPAVNDNATHYLLARYYCDLPQGALQWNSGEGTLQVNGGTLVGDVGGTDILDVFDVALTAGVTYQFWYTSTAGAPRLSLFHGNGAKFLNTIQADTAEVLPGRFSITAPVTGTYGLTIAASAAEPANYALAITSCPFPTALASGAAVAATSPDAWFEYPMWNTYAVVAARGASASDDWDLAAYGLPTGAAPPVCLGSVQASSGYGTTAVDFIGLYESGDASHWLRAHHVSANASAGQVQAVQPTMMTPSEAYTYATLAGTDLVHAYMVYLQAGTAYTFEFLPLVSGLTAHLLPFASGAQAATSRAGAVVAASGTFTYTPSTTAMYVLAVANDRYAGGGYRLRFGACVTAASLASGVPTSTAAGVLRLACPQTAARWSVFGARCTTKDWDVAAATTTGGSFPLCLGTVAANSNAGAGTADFVVTDFHHATPATWYATAYQYMDGPAVSATIEWSSGAALVPNDLYVSTRSLAAGEVVQCWDVHLEAGNTYTIALGYTGSSSLHALLFRNPGSGAYWAGRASAVVDLTPAAGSATYAAPATDDYALVVVDDTGGATAQNYELTVRWCPAAPTALANNVPVAVDPEGFASFYQAGSYFTAVGVRGAGDWDLGVYGQATGGVPGLCFSSPLAASTGVGTVDFVVGSFYNGDNPWGHYYVRPYRYSGSSPGLVEWAEGRQRLVNGADPVTVTTGPNDVLEVWDFWTWAGQPVGIYFSHTGAADLKALVFETPGGGYWAPRSGRVWETTGHGAFTSTSSTWHGLVVVNDNGGEGTYTIGVQPAGVGVDDGAPPPPAVTALRGVAPNPARGGATVEYALHEGASVKLELLDMAGRRVATLEDGERAAGTYHVPLAGVKASGALPPGLYFVRLQVAGRTIGEKKVAIVL